MRNSIDLQHAVSHASHIDRRAIERGDDQSSFGIGNNRSKCRVRNVVRV